MYLMEFNWGLVSSAIVDHAKQFPTVYFALKFVLLFIGNLKYEPLKNKIWHSLRYSRFQKVVYRGARMDPIWYSCQVGPIRSTIPECTFLLRFISQSRLYIRENHGFNPEHPFAEILRVHDGCVREHIFTNYFQSIIHRNRQDIYQFLSWFDYSGRFDNIISVLLRA